MFIWEQNLLFFLKVGVYIINVCVCCVQACVFVGGCSVVGVTIAQFSSHCTYTYELYLLAKLFY